MKLLIRASHSQVTWQHTPRKKPPQLAPSGSSPAVPQAASKWGSRNPLDFTNQQSFAEPGHVRSTCQPLFIKIS